MHHACLFYFLFHVVHLISFFVQLRRTLLALGLAALCAGQAHAARPMNTDDANIVDDKACQLESWVKTTRISLERWAIPGCNLGGDLEWSVGGNAQTEAALGKTTFWVAQAKKRRGPLVSKTNPTLPYKREG